MWRANCTSSSREPAAPPRLFFLVRMILRLLMVTCHSCIDRRSIDRGHPPIHPACCITASPLLLCASHSTRKCSSIPTASRSFTSQISWQFVRTFAVRCFISLLHRPPASCCGSRHVAQVAKHHSPAACRSPLDRSWNRIFIHGKLLCTAESDRFTVKTRLRESSADRGLRCIPWTHVEAKLAS